MHEALELIQRAAVVPPEAEESKEERKKDEAAPEKGVLDASASQLLLNSPMRLTRCCHVWTVDVACGVCGLDFQLEIPVGSFPYNRSLPLCCSVKKSLPFLKVRLRPPSPNTYIKPSTPITWTFSSCLYRSSAG